MDALFKEDHAAFQALIYSHFRHLENQVETWSKLRADLENEIAKKNDLISTHQDTIRELEKQLADARRINTELHDVESRRKEKTLEPSSDQTLAKENPKFDGLQTSKEITPPRRAAHLRPTPATATSDSEKAAFGKAIPITTLETGPWEPATDREKVLLEKYERAQKEASTYKKAHSELLGKYTASKESWIRWTQVFTKDRRRGVTTVSDRKGTPAPKERVPSPPIISPMKSRSFRAVDADSPVQRGGLFSNPPAPVRANSFSGFGSDSSNLDDMRQSAPPSLRKEGSLSSSGPQATAKISPTLDMDPSLPENIAMQAPPVPDTEDFEHTDTSDAEDPYEGSLTPTVPRIKEEPQVSEVPLNTPPITRKRYSDGTQATPIVIKSEPESSENEDPGYFVHNEDDVDLDEVDQPERKKPRKSSQRVSRAKANKPIQEPTRPPLAPLEHTNEELPPPRDPSAAISLKKRENHARAVTPDPPHGDENMHPSPEPTASKKSTRTPYTNRRRKAASPPAPRTPRAASAITKTSSTKKRSDIYNVTAAVVADGTDGTGSAVKISGPPDIDTPVILGDILATPAPKNPTLRNTSRNDGSGTTPLNKSAPPKRSVPWGGDRFVDEEPFDIPATTTPQPSKRTTRSNRKAQTDPPRQDKNSSDIPITAEAPSTLFKNKAPKLTATPQPPTDRPLSVSDFRVNPAMNQGLDYAFKESVRRKEDKRCLPSCTKSCCRDINKFVDAAGLPKASKGPRWRSTGSSQIEGPTQDEEDALKEKEREFLERYGRHKDTFGGLGRRPSPPGFWESDFPDTQEVKRRHEEADRLDQIRVEQLKREAEKGTKGRYVYKGK